MKTTFKNWLRFFRLTDQKQLTRTFAAALLLFAIGFDATPHGWSISFGGSHAMAGWCIVSDAFEYCFYDGGTVSQPHFRVEIVGQMPLDSYPIPGLFGMGLPQSPLGYVPPPPALLTSSGPTIPSQPPPSPSSSGGTSGGYITNDPMCPNPTGRKKELDDLKMKIAHFQSGLRDRLADLQNRLSKLHVPGSTKQQILETEIGHWMAELAGTDLVEQRLAQIIFTAADEITAGNMPGASSVLCDEAILTILGKTPEKLVQATEDAQNNFLLATCQMDEVYDHESLNIALANDGWTSLVGRFLRFGESATDAVGQATTNMAKSWLPSFYSDWAANGEPDPYSALTSATSGLVPVPVPTGTIAEFLRQFYRDRSNCADVKE